MYIETRVPLTLKPIHGRKKAVFAPDGALALGLGVRFYKHLAATRLRGRRSLQRDQGRARKAFDSIVGFILRFGGDGNVAAAEAEFAQLVL